MSNEILLTRGDSKSILDTVTDENGDAFDLTDATIVFTVRRYPDSDIELQKTSAAGQITVVGDVEDGVIKIEIEAGDTSGMKGRYYYDVEVTSGDNVYTVTKDIIEIEADLS